MQGIEQFDPATMSNNDIRELIRRLASRASNRAVEFMIDVLLAELADRRESGAQRGEGGAR